MASMSTGETWRLGRRPALDGLRGLAIIAVVVHHTYLIPVFGFGGVGVTMFFTLSGFLITSLILEEQELTGGVRLTRFFARRARRLLPALAAFAGASMVYGLLRSGGAPPLSDLGYVAAYVGNWAIINGHHLGGFHHTWSLAVEEQFYLLWPLVLLALGRRERLRWWLTVTAVVTSVALRFALWDGGQGYVRVYYGSDTRADALLVGCLLAMHLRRRSEDPRYQPLQLAAALLALPVLTLLAGNVYALTAVVLPTVVPLLMVVAIRSALVRDSGWLTCRALTLVGQRSYALYLWNYFGLAMAWQLPIPKVAQTIIGLAIAWCITQVSWHLVEKWFLVGRPTAVRIPSPAVRRPNALVPTVLAEPGTARLPDSRPDRRAGVGQPALRPVPSPMGKPEPMA